MRWCLIALFLVACSEPTAAPKPADEPAPDRDEWWTAATKTTLGKERLLAPRELRGLLSEGRSRGYDTDGEWWAPKSKWAYARILKLDPDDVEANASVGRKTLQSLPGFESLWKRIAEAKVYNTAIEELLEQYQPWIEEGRPIFLDPGEVEIAVAKMRRASEHLDRMENDDEYAALQVSLERIPSQLRDYPSVHARAGPFLIFFAARDLSRIEGESEEAEDARIGALRDKYKQELDERCKVLTELLEDIRKLYPDLASRYPIAKDDFFFLWIFGDPEWYAEFTELIRAERPESRYRCGFFDKRGGWGFLFLPRKPEVIESSGDEPVEIPDPEVQLRETMAYVAGQQMLRHWGRDPADPFRNRLDRSRAYWLKEGWPSYLAARRVEKPMVGPALEEGWRFGREPPPLRRIIERESRIELRRYREPEPPQGGDEPIHNLGIRQHFTDLAWLVNSYLNEPKTRKQFEAYLLAQIEATAKGDADGFAAAFGLKSEAAWLDLEYAIYAPLDKER
ncbi:MAG: hypothetical protein ACYTHK_12070 [Planctomycetota bacterium]|jgi:hypothetical protein